MSLEITSVVDNKLFGRKDIKFVLRHDQKTTPSRKEMRELVAGEVGAKTEFTVIDHMESATGMAATRGVARAYTSKAELLGRERVHLLKRNNIDLPSKKKTDGGDS